MTRTFDDRPAVREKTPILVGLVGPSGTGKTYSALRLAAGFQRVTGGETFVVDSESRRALHYADRFKFRHVAFGAPFSPLDYLAAFEHCIAKGATTIITDSMSHEHEGIGGVLEMHAAEVERMAGSDFKKAERVKMLAWGKPKAQRRRLINALLQMPCNFIFNFRAKRKLKIVRGQEPVELGWMPIAGDEYIYEMTAKCMLLPGASGAPTWRSEYEGEMSMMKIPEQFKSVLLEKQQLTEDVGEKIARWAAGGASATAESGDDLLKRYAACSDGATWRTLEEARGAAWAKLSKSDKEKVKAASDEAKRRADAAPRTFEATASDPDEAERAEIEAAEHSA
jgi:energy-coupling factor transporter ATP-binding protein EcfA2